MRPKAYPLLLGTRNRPAIDWNFAGSGSLPAALTFSRASLATMYDASGTLVWCPHNLIARSGDASGAEWIKNDVSVAGTTLTVTVAGGSKSINQWIGVVPAGLVTLCLRVRASTSSRVSFGLYSGGFVAATASISSGPGAVSGTGLIQVTELSAGTQTVVVLQATLPPGGVTVYIYPGGDEYGGNAVGDSVEFDDIRLNVGPLQPYYPTTSAAYYGPRLTYDPVTHAALGLLVEEQRTNLLTYSDQLDNAAWTKTNATVTADATAGPDGLVTADKLVDSAATGLHALSVIATITAGASYTLSMFLKPAEYSRGRLYFGSGANGFQVDFDLSGGGSVSGGTALGTGTYTSATITAVANGFYRVAVSGIVDASSTSGTLYCYMHNGASVSYTGVVGNGMYFGGRQLEAGAFATSYIPTGAASATRAADVVTCTGSAFSSWFNATEGTLVVEGVMPNANIGTAAVMNMVYIGDGPGNGYIKVYQYETYFGAAIRHGGAWQADISSTKTAGAVEKLAIAWAVNDAAVAIRGAIVGTDATVAIPTGVDRLTLGTGTPSAVAYTIKRVRYWRKRLTNAQLQALTA